MKPKEGLRILVVDDSPFTRQALRSMVRRDPAVGEVDLAGNGQIALAKALRHPPDIVILDLHMPVMDGFSFLRAFRARSSVPVLVVSSYSDLANVEKALELGASGFTAKPTDPYRNLETIAEELLLKVRQHAPMEKEGVESGGRAWPAPARSVSGRFPVIAIGSSSGGPPSLQYILTSLPKRMGAAVVIAQHMPPGFTETFAKRLSGLLPHPIREASEGETVRRGEILLAPGGRNMVLGAAGDQVRVQLEDAGSAPCVPSVDRLLESAACAVGDRLTAVILTGMGRDGSRGVRVVKDRGGHVIAESSESAIVFGMPREAAATGCVDEVLSLSQIAIRLIHIADRGQGERKADPEGLDGLVKAGESG